MAHVVFIGARPYFEFTPSGPGIAVGWRSPAETRVTMQAPLENEGVKWLVNTVTRVDADNSKLTIDDGMELDYDHLVIATGPRLAFEEVPGVRPQDFTQSVCGQDHSSQAWDRYQAFLKTPGPIMVCTGSLTPVYETYVLKALGIVSLKQRAS